MKRIITAILTIMGFYFLPAQDSVKPNNYQIFYYPNGQKSSEGILVNGKPDGYWISYNENGTLASEGNRKNFVLDSLWIFYNNNGDKTLEINYLDGIKHGKRTRYSESEYIVDFWNKDTMLSPVTTYFLDGKIKKITPNENANPHGMEKIFNNEGRIIAIVNYFHGVMTRREQINRIDQFGFKQGSWKEFWDNGYLKQEGYYINDKKNGFFKYYDEKGNFISVEKWENDNLLKDAEETRVLEMKTAYHKNGKPSITATYHKGKAEGIRREFDTAGNVIKGYIFDNGLKKYEGITDLNGLRQGVWKEFYETGELRSKGSYKNSSPIGNWNFFYPDQTIEIEGSYNKKEKKMENGFGTIRMGKY